MFNTNDDALSKYRPDSVPSNDFKADIEDVIANGAYHSDEVSDTDEEKAQEEITQNIRPKNKNDNDFHVIRVYDKPWRSKRVSIYFIDRSTKIKGHNQKINQSEKSKILFTICLLLQ
jgi:CRISPR/Cas system CSM-associated protein Csm5 (group 7 of RAMP superfamily)